MIGYQGALALQGLLAQEKLNLTRISRIALYVLVVEEVRYDFEDHPRYADDFVKDLLRLMIISKLNSSLRNSASKKYFMDIIAQIQACEAYVVNYGQPLLYVRYRGVEFTDQKVTTQFVRVSDAVVDVTLESMFGDFIKTFDGLASAAQSKVKWAVPDEKTKSPVPDRLFSMLDSFVNAVNRLTTLDKSSADSLEGKRFIIRNASILRKTLHLELMIDGQLNIIEINSTKKRNDIAVNLLLGPSEPANALVGLMKQRV